MKKTFLFLLTACFGFSAFAEDDLLVHTSYNVSSYWDMGALFSAPSFQKTYSTGTMNNSGYGGVVDVRHGVLIEDSTFFELVGRAGFIAGANTHSTALTDTAVNDANAASYLTYEFGGGFGYTMTYIPLRWYIHALYQNSGPVVGASGVRFGMGYFFSLTTSLSVEMVNTTASGSDAIANYQATGSAINVGLSFMLPFSYPEDPWKVRYNDNSVTQ